MEAIEIKSRTDKKGFIRLDYPLKIKDKNVRILILVEDEIDQQDEETEWLKAVSNNPAFHFLQEPEENIYGLNDGNPIHLQHKSRISK